MSQVNLNTFSAVLPVSIEDINYIRFSEKKQIIRLTRFGLKIPNSPYSNHIVLAPVGGLVKRGFTESSGKLTCFGPGQDLGYVGLALGFHHLNSTSICCIYFNHKKNRLMWYTKCKITWLEVAIESRSRSSTLTFPCSAAKKIFEKKRFFCKLFSIPVGPLLSHWVCLCSQIRFLTKIRYDNIDIIYSTVFPHGFFDNPEFVRGTFLAHAF